MQKLNAQKIMMDQIFLEDGTVVPVTGLELTDQDGEVLVEGERVNIQGISKGKGFAGVIKRWGFSGGPKSHGQKNKHRSGGSIGAGTFPGKVWKGKKMPGRMGAQRVTVKNLEVIRVENLSGKSLVWLKGAVPGHRNTHLIIVRLGNMKIEADQTTTEEQKD